jgi:hypothetical protein
MGLFVLAGLLYCGLAPPENPRFCRVLFSMYAKVMLSPIYKTFIKCYSLHPQ